MIDYLAFVTMEDDERSEREEDEEGSEQSSEREDDYGEDEQPSSEEEAEVEITEGDMRTYIDIHVRSANLANLRGRRGLSAKKTNEISKHLNKYKKTYAYLFEDKNDEDANEDLDKYETVVDFVYKKVQLYPTLEDIAVRLGLPIFSEKLVKIEKVVRKENSRDSLQAFIDGLPTNINSMDDFRRYYNARVKKNKFFKYEPYKGKRDADIKYVWDIYRTKTKVYERTERTDPVEVSESIKIISGKEGKKLEEPTLRRGSWWEGVSGIAFYNRRPYTAYDPPEAAKNEIDPRFQIGTYVKYVRNNEEKYGVVIRFNLNGVIVSSFDELETDPVEIPYIDATLRPTERPARDNTPNAGSLPTVDDLLQQDVPENMREAMVKTLTNEFEKVMRPSHSEGKKIKGVEYKDVPFITWEEYYSNEFRAWNFARLREDLEKEVSKKSNIIEEEVDTYLASLVDTAGIIRRYGKLFPDGTLTPHNHRELVLALSNQEKVSAFDAYVISALHKIDPTKFLTGYDLAVELSLIFHRYLSTSFPSRNRLIEEKTAKYIRKLFKTLEPSESDREEFENKKLAKIQRIYNKYDLRYQENRRRYEEGKYQEASQKPIKEKGVEISEQVRIFERLAFAANRKVDEYLKTCLLPLVFLKSSFAKIFKAKITNGEYAISALGSAGLAHYAPELAMNKKLTNEELTDVTLTLDSMLSMRKSMFLKDYIFLMNPAYRYYRSMSSSIPESNLNKYLVVPQKVCKGGYVPLVENGVYVYDASTGQRIKVPIPDGEIVICYDDVSDEFTCHSTADIISQIYKKDLINPYTGRPYPDIFIENTRKRFAKALEKEPVSPKEPVKSEQPKEEEKKKEKEKLVKAPRKRIEPRKSRRKLKEKLRYVTLLGGQPWYELTLFNKSLVYETKEGKKKIYISGEYDKKKTQAVVLIFEDTLDEATLEKLKKETSTITDNEIYVVGVNIPGKDKLSVERKLKRKLNDNIVVIFSATTDEEELKDVLFDVVIDFEGIVE